MDFLKSLKDMTDDFGMVQFSRLNHPDIRSGYTIEDITRALIVASKFQNNFSERKKLIDIYLKFIEYCELPDGRFHNIVREDKTFADEVGSQDALGRTIWGLGEAYSNLTGNYKKRIYPLIFDAIDSLEKKPLEYPISESFALLGITKFHDSLPQTEREKTLESIKKISLSLRKRIQEHRENEWYWPSDLMSYENARIPQALFRSYVSEKDPRNLKEAKELTNFLDSVVFENGFLHIIGNKGWYSKNRTKAKYDQQPVDAGAMTELHAEAYAITKEDYYKKRALRSSYWFRGVNSEGLSLISPEGRIYDGLEKGSVNLNKGAESLLAYQMAALSLNGL